VPWQPPAGKACLCADLMRRLLAGVLQRELTAAGREGRLVCRGNRRPGGPACVPISCAACWRAPYRESWQLPAERADLCAVATAGRGGPACVPISCAACWRAP